MEGGLLMKTYFLAGRAVRIGGNGASAVAKAPVLLAAWTKQRIVSSASFLNPFGRRRTDGRRPLRSASTKAAAPRIHPRRAAGPTPPVIHPAGVPRQLNALRRLRAEIQAVDPSSKVAVANVAAGLGTTLRGFADTTSPVGRILEAAHEVLLQVARGEIADAGEAVSQIAGALEVAEGRPEIGGAAGPRSRKAPGSSFRGGRKVSSQKGVRTGPPPRRHEAPPEVTEDEAAAAEFGGSREKLVFYRALDEMRRGDDSARTRAVRSLGGIRHALSSRAVAARLARDRSAEVRRECVSALTGLGGRESLPAVEFALSDASDGVRLAAVRGVYRLAGPEGAPSLVRMFADEHEDVRRRAIACAGWLGLGHLAAALTPLLKDECAFVRRAALEALANLKSAEAVDDMIDLLDDPEESVARKASEALSTITGRQMTEAFPEDEHGR
ncbi:MAG: HEAT repeat domain-containing protein, partial [Planctomycetota bacterium]